MPMKIALVIGDYDAYGGGAERWTDRHARALLARGHDVHLFARRFRGAPNEAVCHIVSSQGAWLRRRLAFGRSVENQLRHEKFDVVHDMGDGWHADVIMPHHGTRRGSQAQNMKLVHPSVRWLRSLSQQILPRYREFVTLERRKYEHSEKKIFIAVSSMVSENMHRYHSVDFDRIRVVYNGVNTDRFKPGENIEARQQTRQELGVGGNETLFLIVAHNFKLKGLDTLLKAMGKLCCEKKPAHLLVVGDGSISKYQRLARQHDCADSVRFVGDQPDPMPYFHAADVFILPTFYDPCSLVVLEALACGLPIITTRRNGVHELIEQGKEGAILENPDDHEALARSMEIYLSDQVRVKAGAAARKLAEQHSLAHNCDEHIAVYEEVLAAKEEAGKETGDGG